MGKVLCELRFFADDVLPSAVQQAVREFEGECKMLCITDPSGVTACMSVICSEVDAPTILYLVKKHASGKPVRYFFSQVNVNLA